MIAITVLTVAVSPCPSWLSSVSSHSSNGRRDARRFRAPALGFAAAIKEKLREKIIANQLVTSLQALVRNPIYSAFAFVMSGALSNLYLLPLPLVFWAILTVMMQVMRKWLLEQFKR